MKTDYSAINWLSFFESYGLVPRSKRQRKKKGAELVNVYAAFDIETTTVQLSDDPNDSHAFMYVWQMQIEDYTIKGRTWDDWFNCLCSLGLALEKMQEHLKLDRMPMLVIWVHNLAFEWSYISGQYMFTNEECFFRDARKPIYCRMFECFELRCSYIQTNLSLAALTKQSGVPVKLSGQTYDYSKIRFPWTELSEFEEEYTDTDVSSLVQAMKYRVQRGGDTLLTVPLTSTGYVRRECKAALKDRYLEINSLKPYKGENGKRIYKLLRACFRGGNTHANRYYVGKICNDVYSYDIASSYPTQQLTHKFPMKPFKWLDGDLSIDRIMMFVGLDYAVVGEYHFTNIRLKNKREPIPYISLSRCEAYNFNLDNGRILSAEYLEISLTEIDLKIIIDTYEFDKLEITQAMTAQKDFLPIEYRNVILDYYEKKTALKGDDSEDGKYMYMKSKNMLNSVYGMSATDPIHQGIEYVDQETLEYTIGGYNRSGWESMSAEEIQKALQGAAFPYQWGVYTTAYARKQLQDAIELCGDKILYCDTDSVKTLGDVPIHNLNGKLQKAAESAKAFADDMKGKRHYIGLFEPDGHYQQFITQGAKRYAFIKDDGKMGVTVAGVSTKINEETGIPFAVEELKSLKRFKPGMLWKKAGGSQAVYNDFDNFLYTDPESGRQVRISRNVAIIPSTYLMTYARDYALLLKEISLYTDYRRERE